METLFLCALSFVAGAGAVVLLLRWVANEPKPPVDMEARRARHEMFKSIYQPNGQKAGE